MDTLDVFPTQLAHAQVTDLHICILAPLYAVVHLRVRAAILSAEIQAPFTAAA